MLFAVFAAAAILFLELTLKILNVSLRWRLFGLVVSIIAAAYFYPREQSPQATTPTVSPTAVVATPKPTAPVVTNDRIRIAMTPDEIVGLYKSKTSYQAETLVAGLKDKWLDYDGEVADLTSSLTTMTVFAYSGKGDRLQRTLSALDFSRFKYESALSAIRNGDRIAATCQFSKTEGQSLVLVNCEKRP